MATLLKVLNNLADIKSAGGVALRVRTQGRNLALGLILALLAEMTDRRVRSVDDLEMVTSASALGMIYARRRRGALLGGPRRLRAA
jgi:hypothetical protein